ncbi:hypothetical protein Tco_1304953 [Tanacetum coccineum]
MLLAQLQEAGIQLRKDQLAILADTGERIDSRPGAFTVTTNALFQADGVEVYDSDCDDVNNAQPSFMANISSYSSDALAEVHNPNNVDNNMINQGVQYVTESQHTAVQNSNSSVQQDTLILSVIEQLKSQVINCTKINMDSKSVNDSLTAELERYKEQSVEIEHPSPSCRPTKVEVPKELPKVSMVNTSLKKLKPHIAGFDMVVKERTMATTITEGSDNSVSNQGPPGFDQYFEINELKAQSQEKDTVIIKLKERIKSLSGKMNEDKIKKDLEEIETINIELDHRVSKLIVENEHLKQNYKQLYDSIKPTRKKVLIIIALKNELRKLKGKSVIACRESMNKPKVIAPVVHKVDLEPLSPRLKTNREAHVDYIRTTKENADTLRDIVEQARTSNPLDNALAYACMYTKKIQEFLVYVSDTCPSFPLKSEKLVAVTPMNKSRKVTFPKTSTKSYNNTQIQVDVHQTQTTSKPLVPSTNKKCSTNASRSKPRNETKNHRIMQPLSSNQKSQKIEAHTRNAKPSLTKEDGESKYVCLTCNKCYFDARHDFCVVQHLSEVNDRATGKMKEWKPTGKMFKNLRYKWVPT